MFVVTLRAWFALSLYTFKKKRKKKRFVYFLLNLIRPKECSLLLLVLEDLLPAYLQLYWECYKALKTETPLGER